MAHAAVVLPLEAWAERTLAGQVLDDWPQRRRSDALLQDLGWLGLQPPPSLAGMPPVGPASLLGVLYVLEGSRLGAQVLLRRVLAGPDARCRAATAYLGHGAGQALWPGFLAQLEASEHARGEAGPVVAGAQFAFAAFERAAVLHAATRDLAHATVL